MISFLGITIMSTKTREAYRVLVNKSYALHQTINYADRPFTDQVQATIKEQDAALSEAISYVPASDVDTPA